MTWVSLNELSDQTGFAVRTLQYIRQQEPGVLVTRKKGTGVEYKQPDCASNLFKRERRLAQQEINDAELSEAKEKALLTRATRELKDLELALARREQIRMGDVVRVVSGDYEQVRANFMALVGKLPALCVGLRTVAEATAVIEPEIVAALEAVSQPRFGMSAEDAA
jgi:phage terminase Nu1 subunit (DNA packaging protein)